MLLDFSQLLNYANYASKRKGVKKGCQKTQRVSNFRMGVRKNFRSVLISPIRKSIKTANPEGSKYETNSKKANSEEPQNGNPRKFHFRQSRKIQSERVSKTPIWIIPEFASPGKTLFHKSGRVPIQEDLKNDYPEGSQLCQTEGSLTGRISKTSTRKDCDFAISEWFRFRRSERVCENDNWG